MSHLTKSKNLFTACERNSIEDVKDLIKKGANINDRNSLNQTPLHFACQQNSIETVKYLVEKKANVNFETNKEETALIFACQQNSYEIVKTLIEKKADVNVESINEETPLIFACQQKSYEIVKILVENGANVNVNDKEEYKEIPLVIACQKNSVEIVRILVEHGADANVKSIRFEKPLIIACQQNSVEIVRILVEHGANVNVNAKTGYSESPLYIACQQNSFEIVKVLVEHGADPNHKIDYRETPLHYVCQYNKSIDILNYLIEKGADVNAKTKYEETPLHFACKKSISFQIVKTLVEKGADVNAKTKNEETPLYFAFQNNLVTVTEYLIENGADINIMTKEQNTPLIMACQNQNSFKFIEYLIGKGVDVTAKNKYEKTALDYVCKYRKALHGDSVKIAKLLIKNGISVNSKIRSKKVPLLIAKREHNEKLFELLLRNDAKFLNLVESVFSLKFQSLMLQIYSIIEDMKKLLDSSTFSDYRIESNDSSCFLVNKEILSIRLSGSNNDPSVLQKFVNVCQQKAKDDVQIALNFIYTGFPDFEQFKEQISLEYDIFMDNFKFGKSSKFLSLKKQKEQLMIERSNKKRKLRELFKEVGLDLNWIKSKKGRRGILRDLDELSRQDDSKKDFTIICSENENEKEIKVHKLILIIRSELFKGMFELNVADKTNKVHDYSGKSFEAINQFVYFLYHDEFEDVKSGLKKGVIEEMKDFKDYYQLNQNSIIDLVFEDLII